MILSSYMQNKILAENVNSLILLSTPNDICNANISGTKVKIFRKK